MLQLFSGLSMHDLRLLVINVIWQGVELNRGINGGFFIFYPISLVKEMFAFNFKFFLFLQF